MKPFSSLALLFLLLISLLSSIRAAVFDDDQREHWFQAMETLFRDMDIDPENRTSYAITVGLNESDPDLQMSMESFLDQWDARGMTWPWDQFKDDISRVSEAAKDFRAADRPSFLDDVFGSLKGFTDAEVPDKPLDRDGASIQAEKLHASLSRLDSIITQIDRRHTHTDVTWPGINLPSWIKDALRTIREALNVAVKELEHVVQLGVAKAPEVIKAVHDFIVTQIELLPNEIRDGIAKLQELRQRHPYITAAATIVISIGLSELVFAPAAMGLLRLVGFSELGPLAGSWAALIQSVFYGARTRGLFSIIQAISMGAKNFWPVAVFLDLSSIGIGMALWSAAAVKEIVEQWRSEIRPDMRVMLDMVVDEKFMREVGGRCLAAGIPEVQWLTVALQFVSREVENSVHSVL